MNRTEMRRCGKRYASEDEARCSKRGLQPDAAVVPCHVPNCGGWHVRPATASAWHPLNAGDTGPDTRTRRAVYIRDGFACVCCGQSVIGRPHSLGHRKRRSQGGGNCLANLLTFLGLGNGLTADDHHYRIDNRDDPEDEARGYTVRSRQDPHLISVMVFSDGGSGVTRFPTCDGQWAGRPGETAA